MTDSTYHLVGIGGIGMSAIARLLLARGARVSGSDVRRSELVEALEAEGARISIGHRASNLGADVDVVVVSSAIARDNPEFGAALERRLSIVTRGEMLAKLAEGHKLVAVAGTHGKTTTTAMLATIFERAGLEPTVAVGGLRVDAASNARAGAGTWFVTESDESDGSFLHLSPTIAVINNIENDHISSDDELPRLLEQFTVFANKVPPTGRLVAGVDNKMSALVGRAANAPVSTFATRAEADLTAALVRYEDLGARFEVRELGTAIGEIALSVPGEINVLNALGALGAARAAGIPFDTIAGALASFRGVRRRFEIVGRGAITVVDDYAHHPTAIAQTIAAARGFAHGAPVLVAFQPHRYTRTAYLKDDFARALATADGVFLCPIYAASEDPIPGISEQSIGEPLRNAGLPVTYVDDVAELVEVVPREVPPGALVLMLGAGSISGVAHTLGERIGAALTR